MSLYEELTQRFLKDLQTGLRFPVHNPDDTWGEKYLDYQTILKSYCVNTVLRNVFLSRYKTLPPIETFPAEEKTRWKAFVNEIFPGTPPIFRLEAVKIIYTIGALT